MKCEHCLPQMLPFVYDLLEADERSSVAAHLEQCASCQEALKAAQEQAGLLAEAVKDNASGFVFQAPPQHAITASAPTVAMAPRPRRPIFLLNRWSIAAGLLLAFFAVGGVIGWTVWQENTARLDEARARLAKAREDQSMSQQDLNQQKGQTQKEIRAIQEQINQLFNDWRSEENKKRKVEQDRVQVSIKGPEVAIAGANNSYQIQMFQNDQRGVSNSAQGPGIGNAQTPQQGMANQKLKASVYNQHTQVPLFKQDLITQPDGTANFILPSDIPFTPGDDLVLVFETHSPDGKLVKLGDSVKLVFPEYLTHLTTDRPLYRPGDTVRFRSLTLERFSLKPAQQALHLRYRIVGPDQKEQFSQDVATERLTDRNKSALRGPRGAPLHGVGAGEFLLPHDLPGGQYTLFVNEVNDRFIEEKRTFFVHHWQAPRLNKEVQFDRSSYGAGDLVRVQIKVVPLAGLVPAGMKKINVQVTATANVDGTEIPINNQPNNFNFTDENGVMAFTFTLPPQIPKGVGSVSFLCDDGGHKETARRTIPIVVNNLELDFYPEGGDLIAGVPNRVYFQARTPANRHADVEAVVLDDNKQVVARIKTLTDDSEPGINQGLGSFIFTPRAKARYIARIDVPIGIDRTYPLPPAKDKGLVMTIPRGVVTDEIGVTLYSVKQARDLLVGAYCRGRMLHHKFVHAAADQPTEVTLKPQGDVGGVYRVTVFEKKVVAGNLVYRPLVERLVYRKSEAKVKVLVDANQPTYQPGESVALSLRAINEKKEQVPAYAMIAVVNESVLKLADEKTARTMPTHFLLATEVRHPEDLENADVLLGTHPKAAQALDLLLGCQGWRRFAEQDPEQFQRRLQQAKPPAFLPNANPVSYTLDAEPELIGKVDRNYVGKAIELEKTLGAKESQEGEWKRMQDQAPALAAVAAAEMAKAQAEERLRELGVFCVQFLMGGALLLFLFVGFFLISVGLRRLAEGEPARYWLLIGISLLGFLFCASVVGTFMLMGQPLMDVGGGRGLVRPQPPVMMPPVAPGIAAPAMHPAAEEIREETLESEVEPPKDEPKARAMKKPAAAGNLAGPVPQNFGINNDNPGNNNAIFNQNWQNNERNNLDLRNRPDERELRRQGHYQAILQNQLGRRVQLPTVDDACIVREYAHLYKPRKDDAHRDFAQTLYWHPILVMPDGTARVKFDLSDSVTRFQVLVFSHTADGRLGADRIELTSRLPFSVDPKAPVEVTNTDKITIPVTLGNQWPQPTEATVSARVKGLNLEGPADCRVVLGPHQSKREMFKVEPNVLEGAAVVRVASRTKNASDAVERRFKVVQEGFPITRSAAGVFENGSAEHTITLPEQWLAGSLQVQANFYPSPVAELQSGLEAMLREPAGCFEQCASSNNANMLILDYMKIGSINVNFQPNPILEKRARQSLNIRNRELANFECVDPQNPTIKRGYEWFGGTAAPNVALTAYALLQFRDLARFCPVDAAMLERTEQYLLDQRDLKGGFKRDPKGIDPLPDPVANACVVWALSGGAAKTPLDAELAAVRASCKDSKDPYLLALAALGHLNRGKKVEGAEMLRELVRLQKADGELPGATASITGSQGNDLLVESTALAALAWLKTDQGEFAPNVHRAVKWLGQHRRGAGGFGATQATILALKALISHAERFPRPMQAGEVTMVVRDTGVPAAPAINNFAPGMRVARGGGAGQPEADRAFFSPRSHDPIHLSLRDVSRLSPGKNVIQLSTQAPSPLPYTLTCVYRTLKPANDPKAPVHLEASLNKQNAREGDVVKLSVRIENVSGKGQGMAVAVIGLPAGLSVPEDFEQLKAYAQLRDGGARPGKISAWELRGRELVLYWRDLTPAAKNAVEIDLVCRLPGSYRGPASRAYLYYDADRKHWIDPLSIQIDPAP